MKYQEDFRSNAAANKADITQQETQQLIGYIKNYASSTAQRNNLDMQMIALSYQRKLNLLSLMQTNPDAVINDAKSLFALQPAINQLSDSVKINLEKEVYLQGRVDAGYTESFSKKTYTFGITLTTSANEVFQIHNSSKASVGEANVVATIQGIQLDSQIALEKSNIVSKVSAVPINGRNQKIAVLLINQQTTFSPQSALLNDFEPFLTTASFNNASLDHAISVYHISVDYGQVLQSITPVLGNANDYLCGDDFRNKLADVADAQAKINRDNYSHIIYSMARVPCDWEGAGLMPGNRIWLNGYDGNYHSEQQWVELLEHEIGHNYGMDHADSYSCTIPGGAMISIASPNQCSYQEYGDNFDPMGPAPNDLNFLYNNYHKWQMGWLSSSNVISLSTKNDLNSKCNNGLCILNPSEQNSAPSVITFPANRSIGGSQMYYYLEYRQPLGQYDTSDFESVHEGILIRLAGSKNSGSKSYLVGAVNGIGEVLQPGETFYDPFVPVQIEVKNILPGISGYAAVQISFQQNLGQSMPCGTLGGICMHPADFGRNKGMCLSQSGVSYKNDHAGDVSCESAGIAGEAEVCCIPQITPTPTSQQKPRASCNAPSYCTTGTYCDGYVAGDSSKYNCQTGYYCCTPKSKPSPTQASKRQDTCTKVMGQVCTPAHKDCSDLAGDYVAVNNDTYQCLSSLQTCCRPAKCSDFGGACISLRMCSHTLAVDNKNPRECDQMNCPSGEVCGF